MAKKKKAKGDSKRSAALSGPLAPGIDAFHRGDYVVARQRFDEAMVSSDLSDENKQVAKTLRASLGLDLSTLYVGLACIGLYLLVILVAILKQP